MQILGQRSTAFWTVVGGICALVGVGFTAIQVFGTSPASQSAPPRVDSTVSGASAQSPNPQSPSPSASATRSSVPTWSGRLSLTRLDEVNLDADPPLIGRDVERYDFDYYSATDPHAGIVSFSAGVKYAAWQNADPPTQQQCVQALNDFGRVDPSTGYFIYITVSTRVCLRTKEGSTARHNIVFLQVDSIAADLSSTNFSVTRWVNSVT